MNSKNNIPRCRQSREEGVSRNAMTKLMALFATAIFLFQPLVAEKVSVETARNVAVQTLSCSSALHNSTSTQQKSQVASKSLQLLYTSSNRNKSGNTISILRSEPADETVYFYVFGTENNDGFVIVSGDDRVAPVLGYSATNGFSAENMPENLQWWLGEYAKQIQYAIENNVEPTAEVQQQWTQPSALARSTATTVAPLLTTTWNQWAPYNNLCPMDGEYRTPTGCVATAMAQIMKYWNYPTARTVTIPSYTTETHGIVIPAITGTTTYDWNNMKNTFAEYDTDAQRNAVATLMKECGASVKMDYDIGGSGASSFSAANALFNYFGYDQSALYQERRYYNDDEWHALLRDELDNGRPVYYGGFGAYGMGHVFVCDGYRSDNYFHLNWGWGGSGDGYFTTNPLLNDDGESLDYTDNQGAITYIKPDEGGVTPLCSNSIAYGKIGLLTWELCPDSTLTISGNGRIIGFEHAPWDNHRNSIKNVAILEGVLVIGDYAFSRYSNLTSVTIPNSVTSIGDAVFFECSNLTDVTVNWATPLSINSNVFIGVTLSNVNLHVPENSYDLYAAANVWKDFNLVRELVPQTITFNPLPAKIYGDESFTLSASSSSGLPVTFESNNTTVATVSDNTITIVGAGEASITASQAGNAEYAAATISQTLTVNKAPLTVTVDNKTREYGEANPNLTYLISGFKNSETQSVIDVFPTVSTTATQTSDAGNYAITVQNASDNNYDFNYTNGNLSITKAALTVTANNKTRPQGQPNPAFTLSYNGFKNADKERVLDVLPTISCNANETSPAGFYNIVLSGGSDNNYAYTLVNGLLEVTAVAPTTYIITATVTGAGGTIAPEGSVTVNAGSNKTFVFTPDNNYQICLVLIDEIPNAQAKADGYYTFTNITDNHTISVLFETNTSIEDVVAGQLKIFRNPVKEDLFIKSNLQIQKVEIYTLSGALLLSENNFNEKISVSALPKGVYLLKVYSGSGVAVSKIVKE